MSDYIVDLIFRWRAGWRAGVFLLQAAQDIEL